MMPESWEKETVSYTHLDVYKRQPETAPHAIVTNKIGNKYCPSTLKPLNAARLHDGLATNTPIIAPTIINISK